MQPVTASTFVAALHDAGLEANSWCLCRHRPDVRYPGQRIPPGIGDDDSNEEEDDRLHIKIPPPIFKGLPGEWHNAHLLAIEDWMEAMSFRVDDHIDKFKHTYSIWLGNGTMV